MSDKIVFRELLSELKEKAVLHNDVLTKDEIKNHLKDANLSEDQMSLVYEYLISEKITVKDFKGSKQGASLLDERKEVTKNITEHKHDRTQRDVMYEEFLKSAKVIEPEKEGEEEQLYEKILAGDPLAQARLIELYITTVIEIAENYATRGVLLSELVSEGNVGLMIAVDSLKKETLGALTKDEVKNKIVRSITESIESALEINDLVKEAGEKAAKKVNFLKDAIENLKEDLGKDITLEELSAYIEMSKEDIMEILSMTGGEIELEDDL